ncbi:MAG: hypothetical protein PHU54_09700 [Candidatus Omnitrophica bacterium]|nr:hypothetical protein [Candidatus Omnitrophota bacterium]
MQTVTETINNMNYNSAKMEPMTRDEVLKRLEPISGTKMKAVETTPRTKVSFTPDAIILQPGSGGKLVPISKEGLTSLANYVGVSTQMITRLNDNTASTVLSELLQKKGSYVYHTKDDTVLSFYPDTKRIFVPVDRVVATIEKAVPDAAYIRTMVDENNVVYIEMMGERRAPVNGSLLQNDIIAGGAFVAFSPMGTIKPVVRSYCLRVACTNGMITPVKAFGFEFGGNDGDSVWQWFRDSIRKAYQSVTKIAGDFSAMTAEKIQPSDRAALLESMMHQAGIKDEIADALRAQAIERPPESSWDMTNLISFGTSHLMNDEKPKRLLKAMNSISGYIGGARHNRECPMCHRSGRIVKHEPRSDEVVINPGS